MYRFASSIIYRRRKVCYPVKRETRENETEIDGRHDGRHRRTVLEPREEVYGNLGPATRTHTVANRHLIPAISGHTITNKRGAARLSQMGEIFAIDRLHKHRRIL